MARRGRRLTIGGSGTEDDAVGGTPRGEIKSYLPPSEADQAAQAAAIAAAATPSPDAAPPIIVMPPSGDSGGGDAGTGQDGTEGAGSTGTGGPGEGGGEGAFARGGIVKGSGAEHVITAQAGEYIINAAAVKKYGLATIAAINSGKAQVMDHDAAQQHFAKGGMVLGGGGRFKKLEGQLADKGAKDPAALAAYIGRKKYGAKRFARLAHGGH